MRFAFGEAESEIQIGAASSRYLGDPTAIQAAAEAVKRQAEKRA